MLRSSLFLGLACVLLAASVGCHDCCCGGCSPYDQQCGCGSCGCCNSCCNQSCCGGPCCGGPCCSSPCCGSCCGSPCCGSPCCGSCCGSCDNQCGPCCGQCCDQCRFHPFRWFFGLFRCNDCCDSCCGGCGGGCCDGPCCYDSGPCCNGGCASCGNGYVNNGGCASCGNGYANNGNGYNGHMNNGYANNGTATTETPTTLRNNNGYTNNGNGYNGRLTMATPTMATTAEQCISRQSPGSAGRPRHDERRRRRCLGTAGFATAPGDPAERSIDRRNMSSAAHGLPDSPWVFLCADNGSCYRSRKPSTMVLLDQTVTPIGGRLPWQSLDAAEKIPLTIYLSADLAVRLKQVAEVQKRTPADMAAVLLDRNLPRRNRLAMRRRSTFRIRKKSAGTDCHPLPPP